MIKKLIKQIKCYFILGKIAKHFPLYHKNSYKFSKNEKYLFNQFVNTEIARNKKINYTLIDTLESDLEKLYMFCYIKRILIFIPVVLTAEKIKIKNKIRHIISLKTIIDGQRYANWYLKQYESDWLKKDWTKKGKNLPIIANINGSDVVIDGNHRLAQQIHQNRIKYIYVTGDISWKKTFRKIFK